MSCTSFGKDFDLTGVTVSNLESVVKQRSLIVGNM
jgi:hypothetical protein